MYNSEKPNLEDLPSTRQLLRSTAIAFVAAVAILLTAVLPAEYGIDPTGIGRLLGLAEMGEIKTQLAEEAESDRQRHLEPKEPVSLEPQGSGESAVVPDKQSLLPRGLIGLLVGVAQAHSEDHGHGHGHDASGEETAPAAVGSDGGRSDEIQFALAPAQGIEIKLVMEEGASADFAWSVDDGVVNFDLHGDNDTQSVSYEKKRGVPGAEGTLTAAFTGNHGWFWRNRGKKDVTITLSVKGDYSAIKRYE